MKLNIRKFKLKDEEEVIDLWRACGLVVPWNNPHLDIQRKLKSPAGIISGWLSRRKADRQRDGWL